MTVQVLMNKFSCAKEVYKIAIIRWSIDRRLQFGFGHWIRTWGIWMMVKTVPAPQETQARLPRDGCPIRSRSDVILLESQERRSQHQRGLNSPPGGRHDVLMRGNICG